ncbi:MAG: hypothetical protein U1E39_08595 [Planctomycetota bacterium]
MPDASPARAAVAALAVARVLAACGDAPPAPSPRTVGPVRGEPGSGAGLASLRTGPPYREGSVPPAAGAVVGRVTLRGPAVDPVYEAWPGMGTDVPTPAGRVVVGEGAALADVVVVLVGVTGGKPFPPTPRGEGDRLRLVAEAGRVRPFVSVVRVGTQLELENRLRGTWVVHGFEGAEAGRTAFNVSVEPGAILTDVVELWLGAPGVTFVTEDGRGAFHAYVVAVPHPYVDVTRAVARGDVGPGGFRLADVPPGAYDVVAWHPGLSMRARGDGRPSRYVASAPVEAIAHVTVRPGAVVDVAFEFEAPGAGGSSGR